MGFINIILLFFGININTILTKLKLGIPEQRRPLENDVVEADVENIDTNDAMNKKLYRAAREGKWEEANEVFNEDPEFVSAKITKDNETALHVAVGSGHKKDLLKKLINLMPEDALGIIDGNGETALAVAATVGNFEAVKMLVERNEDLLYIWSGSDSPLHRAAQFGHGEIVAFLLDKTKANIGRSPFADLRGVLLVEQLITSRLYDLALRVIREHRNIVEAMPRHKQNSPLMALANQPSSFFSGTSFNCWESFLYKPRFFVTGNFPVGHHSRISPDQARLTLEFYELGFEKKMHLDGISNVDVENQNQRDDVHNQNQNDDVENHDQREDVQNQNQNVDVENRDQREDVQNQNQNVDVENHAQREDVQNQNQNVDMENHAQWEDAQNQNQNVNVENHAQRADVQNQNQNDDVENHNQREDVQNQNQNVHVENHNQREDVQNQNQRKVQLHREVSCWSKIGSGFRNAYAGLLQTISKGTKVLFAMYSLAPCIKKVQNIKKMHKSAQDVVNYMCKEISCLSHEEAQELFKVPFLHAATWGIKEIVNEVIKDFPPAIWFNRDGYSLFHLAVLNRRREIFNLIHDNKRDVNQIIRNHIDRDQNNLLHLAAKLAPSHRLSLISGSVMQMQIELQWFKKVESLVEVHYRDSKNKDGKTPEMVFIEEHKDLVKEAADWMHKTASACTTAATLIASVAFAAAIAVPQAKNSSTGSPVALQGKAFTTFAISDATALFTATASLLTFLAILTSRYSHNDFLKALPGKLILGFVTLFVAMTFLMVAFSSALHLVIGHRGEHISTIVDVLCGLVIWIFLIICAYRIRSIV